jgi:hypothetical protein
MLPEKEAIVLRPSSKKAGLATCTMTANAYGPAPPPILRLPAEIRREIFITFFRSTTIMPEKPTYANHDLERGRLAVLSVCRQFYHEASPLALPNITVFCNTNASVAETLSKMSPAQLTQLRHLVVTFVPVGFPLFLENKSTGGVAVDAGGQGGSDAKDGDSRQGGDGQGKGGSGDIQNDGGTSLERDSSDDDDSDGEEEDDWRYDEEEDDWRYDWHTHIPKFMRHFHLGAVLGLFPGLQLDLLEVYCGTGGSSVTSMQVIDCFGSLLEADGYRELWMEAAGGDSEWSAGHMPSMNRWKKAFATRFKPYGGKVQFQLDRYEWDDRDRNPFWATAREAGITLVKGAETYNDDYDKLRKRIEEGMGHESEHAAGIVLKRGDAADIAVKADNGVLRCIQRDDGRAPKSYFKKASDALRKLFKEKDWDSIKAMKDFDNGDLTDFEGGGNTVYMSWY